MTGPFVDRDHPLISSGKVDKDEFEIFQSKIVPKLQFLKASKPNLEIIMLPSQQESCLEWIAFPQVFLL